MLRLPRREETELDVTSETARPASPTIRGRKSDGDPSLADAQLAEAAEAINTILHNGAIAANDRGKVVACLLLSLVAPGSVALGAPLEALVAEINSRASEVLRRRGRPELAETLAVRVPATRANHDKFQRSLVKALGQLNDLDVRSAVRSGTDTLGPF